MTPEETLAYCLTEIEAGRKTAAECLALFPDIPDLEAQLRTAQSLQAWPAPTLRPEASRRIEAQLRQRLHAPSRKNSNGLLSLPLRWAVALVLVAIFLISAGMVAASANSLPGEALYSVKRAGESVQLFFTPATAQASAHATLAQRRLDEMAALAERGLADSTVVAALAEEVTAETRAALAGVANAPQAEQAQLLETIALETKRQQTVLGEIKETVSPQLQAQLDEALEAAIQNNASAQLSRDGFPGETASPTSTEELVESTSTAIPIEPTRTLPAPTSTASATRSEPSHTPEPQATHSSPSQTHTPPGLIRKTETAVALPNTSTPAPEATSTSSSGQANAPNCNANNPNSPNYCTSTPAPEATNPPSENNLTATACPTNASGKPKCK